MSHLRGNSARAYHSLMSHLGGNSASTQCTEESRSVRAHTLVDIAERKLVFIGTVRYLFSNHCTRTCIHRGIVGIKDCMGEREGGRERASERARERERESEGASERERK